MEGDRDPERRRQIPGEKGTETQRESRRSGRRGSHGGWCRWVAGARAGAESGRGGEAAGRGREGDEIEGGTETKTPGEAELGRALGQVEIELALD